MKYEPTLRRKLSSVFMSIMLVTLISGCSTARSQSQIPELLLKAKDLKFNREQKVFVGLLLNKLNDCEAK